MNVDCLTRPVHLGTVRLNKEEFAINFTYTTWRNCCYVTKTIDSVRNFSSDKYQTDADQLWLADKQTPSATNQPLSVCNDFLPQYLFFYLCRGKYTQWVILRDF